MITVLGRSRLDMLQRWSTQMFKSAESYDRTTILTFRKPANPRKRIIQKTHHRFDRSPEAPGITIGFGFHFSSPLRSSGVSFLGYNWATLAASPSLTLMSDTSYSRIKVSTLSPPGKISFFPPGAVGSICHITAWSGNSASLGWEPSSLERQRLCK